MSNTTDERTPAPGSDNAVQYYPGVGDTTVSLVPDPSKYTVIVNPSRSVLTASASALLRERANVVSEIPHYGMRILDGRTRQRRDASVTALNDEVAVELASPVLHRHSADGDEVYVTRNVLVQFAPDVSADEVNSLLAAQGAEIVRALGYADNGFLVQAAAGSGGLGAFTLANALRESGRTIFAHPDLVSARHKRTVTDERVSAPVVSSPARKARDNGDLISDQWHLTRAGVIDAWNITRGSSSITVAIMDDGVDTGHPEFAGKITNQHSFEDHNSDGGPRNTGDDHGTACAGVAVAAGVRASGSAPDCSLMAIRYPTIVGDSDEADMFRWAADNGADVISCSWGASDGTGQTDILPGATQVAIQYARSTGRGGKGTPVCWAAGNGNESVDIDGYAANPHVIAIAALNSDDTRSWYSDRGRALWVTAPSSGRSPQKAITTTDRQGSDGYNDGSEGVDADYTNSFGGTSSATPLVAGIIGLMLSANPDLTATEVYFILRDTAEKVDSGYDANGHSVEYGYGLVNALEAVRKAQAGTGGGGGTGTPGTITAASSHDRADGPPQFEVDPHDGGSFYAVEVADRAALLDGGDHDAGFFGSWQNSDFQSSSPYVLPEEAWDRLKGADELYYRAWFSSSSTEWNDVTVTTENDAADQAPRIVLTGGQSGGGSDDDSGGGSDGETPTRAPSISGPSSVFRSDSAPTFEVDPGDGPASFYAVEVATDPSLFDDASHPIEDGWWGTWTNGDFLATSTFTLPDEVWAQLGSSASQLYYRAWFSSSSSEWADTVVTTDAAASSSAPSITISDDGDRTVRNGRSGTPSGTRVRDLDELLWRG